MRYAYHDLGDQPAVSTAVIHWRGSAADVLLLDPVNFCKYREGKSAVLYSGGGRYGRSPARLSIPEDEHWYIVADFGGTSTKATVEILKPHGGEPRATEEEPLLEVG